MGNYWHRGSRWMSANWADHLARGSEGGEDFAMPVGTPLYAPTDGLLRFRVAGTGGWTLTLEGDDGIEYEAMHCSDAVIGLAAGRIRVVAGQFVGRSGGAPGAPGAGSSTGPHCHEHCYIGGVRRPISASGGVIPAGDNYTEFQPPLDLGDDDMTKVIGHKDTEIAVLNPWLPKGRKVYKLSDVDKVNGFGRLYSPTRDSLIPMYERAVYLNMLAAAEDEADAVRANLLSLLGGSGGAGVVDLQPILDAIAAAEAQDAADKQEILAAIDRVDEATLAAFGLKRA